MNLKQVIKGKLSAIEEDLKIIAGLVIEIQTERAFIEYLLEEDDKEGKMKT